MLKGGQRHPVAPRHVLSSANKTELAPTPRGQTCLEFKVLCRDPRRATPTVDCLHRRPRLLVRRPFFLRDHSLYLCFFLLFLLPLLRPEICGAGLAAVGIDASVGVAFRTLRARERSR